MQTSTVRILVIIILLGLSVPMKANDDKDILIKSRMENVAKELRYLREYTKETKRIAGNGSGRIDIKYEKLVNDLNLVIEGLKDMLDYNPKQPKEIIERIEEVEGEYSI